MDQLQSLINLRRKRVEMCERNLRLARELITHLKESLKAKTIAFTAYKQKVKFQVDAIYEDMYDKELTQNELHKRLGGVTTWYAKIKEREVELSDLKVKIEKAHENLEVLKQELLRANISLEKIKTMQERLVQEAKRVHEYKSEQELEEFKVQDLTEASLDDEHHVDDKDY